MLSQTMRYRLSSRIILILLLSCCLFSYFEASGEIYKYVDKEGVIHYSNRSKNPNYKLLQVFKSFSRNKVTVTRTGINNKNSEALNGIIENVAGKFGQDPKLIQSIIKTESNFNANAVSPKGAMGLMQLMPDTARRFRVKDPFRPEENIEGGVAYFDYLMKLFNNDLELALAAYNAGENRVINYSGIPPFEETQDYVRKILNSYKGERIEKIDKVYKIIKNDGTILFTNNPE